MIGRAAGFSKSSILFFLLRVTLGGVFVYASLYKISSPPAFAHSIYNFRLLPSWAINPAALILPWLQFFCGWCLIFNRWTLAAASWIVLMLVVFQAAVASALMRGLNISCGCFHSGGPPASWLTFGRDSLLLLWAGIVWWTVYRESRRKNY